MATDPFVTGGSSGVLVHDLTPYSSAQDANDLDSQALLPGHPGLKYGSGIFHGRSDRGAGVESGNASATMRDRLGAGVSRASMRGCWSRPRGAKVGLSISGSDGGCDRYNSRAGKFSNNKIGGVVFVLLHCFMTVKYVLQGTVRFVGKILHD